MPHNTEPGDERVQHLGVMTGRVSYLARAVVVFLFVGMHASLGFAGSGCCMDRVMEEFDECEDEASDTRYAEGKDCLKKLWPPTIRRCIEKAYQDYRDDLAECRSTRDRDLRACNI